MYQGHYNDKEYHPPDLDTVLERAWAAGVAKIIVTAGSLKEAREALELVKRDDRLFCTVGVHPTRCGEFDAHPGGPEEYLAGLAAVVAEGVAAGKTVAIGECGLDYERLHFCDETTQTKYFEAQFSLAKASGLPMFLHLRGSSAVSPFVDIVARHAGDFPAGVVHSFDGNADELVQVLALGQLSIGINGCSLKTVENLDVMAQVPVGRLMLETDCPWCEIRSTHAGKQYIKSAGVEARDRKKHDPTKMVKSRNEPCNMVQVLEVVAGHRGVEDVEGLSEAIWHNTLRMFFPREETSSALDG
ncbi:hypothetical protein FOA52_012482 [Chlamydomonas sp. UWO 241]|nr:hypothetical protein FOA52_012482 [Chlamydomonas sp. UWO 241]